MSGSVPGIPIWTEPEGVSTGIFLKNSLANRGDKVELKIREDEPVRWYSCGPTVYDVSHVGHLRNYVCLDINRRILEDYFGLDTVFVMNITDVDDKIIIRTHEKFLLDLFNLVRERATASGKDTNPTLAPLLEEVSAFLPQNKREMGRKGITMMHQFEVQLREAGQSLGLLSEEEISRVPDFQGHARHFEKDFFEDMEAMNVKAPDCLTRVTEYMPEVVAFIQGIVDKGYAYVSSGSVYFDTVKYRADGRRYPKIKADSSADVSLLRDGDTLSNVEKDAKCAEDFALWKASMEGEPSWDSPWGPGRPGWHIECSAMASSLFGGNMDIHSGGEDLCFPHHDNELAQSEAYFGNNQWVNYFTHVGHLHIDGLKMSKSLKNFTTIKASLQQYNAKQLRMFCLLHKYNDRLDFSEDTVFEAIQTVKFFSEFFQNVKAKLRELDIMSVQNWRAVDLELKNKLSEVKRAVRKALQDDFNTPAAINALRDLVFAVNVYLQKEPRETLLVDAAGFVSKIFRVFGLSRTTTIGFDEGDSAGGNREEVLTPYLDTLCEYRSQVRELARQGGPESVEHILRVSDEVRDRSLIPLGVRLEDKAEGSIWKFDDPKELQRELDLKREAQLRKEEQRAAQEELKRKREAKKAMDPRLFFLDDGYCEAALDDKGLPIAQKDGQPFTSKNVEKKAVQAWVKQAREHNKWRSSKGLELLFEREIEELAPSRQQGRPGVSGSAAAVDGKAAVSKKNGGGEKGGKGKRAPAVKSEPDISELVVRVGRIVECQLHPDAESLYLEKIDVGESEPRQIISGLVKHVPLEEMLGRSVLVLCNLRPAKLRGVDSFGMVLCASEGDVVKFVDPPVDAVVGERVTFEGFEDGQPADVMVRARLEAILGDLTTDENGILRYRHASSKTSAGPCVSVLKSSLVR